MIYTITIFLITVIFILVEVRQEYCRAHHLSGNYRTAVTLEIKFPQTEMPHPDDACISVMTTEK